MLACRQQLQRLVSESALSRALADNLLPANNNACFLDAAGDGVFTATLVVEQQQKAERRDDGGGVSWCPVAFGLFNVCDKNQAYCSLVSVSEKFADECVAVERVNLPEQLLGLAAFARGSASEETKKECSQHQQQRHVVLKITKSVAFAASSSAADSQHQFARVFGEPETKPVLQCVVDQLISAAVGSLNFDNLRNVTVDLYDAPARSAEEQGVNAARSSNAVAVEQRSDVLWRDFAGFIVTDYFRFCEVDVEIDALHSLLAEEQRIQKAIEAVAGVRFDPLSGANRSLVLEFERAMSVFDRHAHIAFLLGLSGLVGVVGVDSGNTKARGYGLALNGRVLQMYAESADIANGILSALLTQLSSSARMSVGGNCNKTAQKSSLVSLFFRMNGENGWETVSAQLPAAARETRCVRRFSTRMTPLAGVKWERVFVANIGAHLF